MIISLIEHVDLYRAAGSRQDKERQRVATPYRQQYNSPGGSQAELSLIFTGMYSRLQTTTHINCTLVTEQANNKLLKTIFHGT